MDWLTRMNAAVAYIEDHLDDEIDYDKLASIACTASHNFIRMFSFIMDVSVANIPAHTWAIFPSEKFSWDDADEAIGGLYKRIFSEWLPTSAYEQVGSLAMELYGGEDGQGYIEIWLAVKKKH